MHTLEPRVRPVFAQISWIFSEKKWEKKTTIIWTKKKKKNNKIMYSTLWGHQRWTTANVCRRLGSWKIMVGCFWRENLIYHRYTGWTIRCHRSTHLFWTQFLRFHYSILFFISSLYDLKQSKCSIAWFFLFRNALWFSVFWVEISLFLINVFFFIFYTIYRKKKPQVDFENKMCWSFFAMKKNHWKGRLIKSKKKVLSNTNFVRTLRIKCVRLKSYPVQWIIY